MSAENFKAFLQPGNDIKELRSLGLTLLHEAPELHFAWWRNRTIEQHALRHALDPLNLYRDVTWSKAVAMWVVGIGLTCLGIFLATTFALSVPFWAAVVLAAISGLVIGAATAIRLEAHDSHTSGEVSALSVLMAMAAFLCVGLLVLMPSFIVPLVCCAGLLLGGAGAHIILANEAKKEQAQRETTRPPEEIIVGWLKGLATTEVLAPKARRVMLDRIFARCLIDPNRFWEKVSEKLQQDPSFLFGPEFPMNIDLLQTYCESRSKATHSYSTLVIDLKIASHERWGQFLKSLSRHHIKIKQIECRNVSSRRLIKNFESTLHAFYPELHDSSIKGSSESRVYIYEESEEAKRMGGGAGLEGDSENDGLKIRSGFAYPYPTSADTLSSADAEGRGRTYSLSSGSGDD